MNLANDSPSFTPAHSQIRTIKPSDLNHEKGCGLAATTQWSPPPATGEQNKRGDNFPKGGTRQKKCFRIVAVLMTTYDLRMEKNFNSSNGTWLDDHNRRSRDRARNE